MYLMREWKGQPKRLGARKRTRPGQFNLWTIQKIPAPKRCVGPSLAAMYTAGHGIPPRDGVGRVSVEEARYL